jgi:hypothetical protein
MARNICRNGHFLTRNIIATSLSFFAHWLRNIPQGPPLRGPAGLRPWVSQEKKTRARKPPPLAGHQRRRHPEKATYLTADNQMTRNLTVRRRTPADMADTTVPLTADNQMTRKPNLALNAEMKAVAEWLTLPAVFVHFFRFAPTAIE